MPCNSSLRRLNWDKFMQDSQKKDLTKQDALEKMCADIRQIAEVKRYGTIWYPTMANPSIFCILNNGLVTYAKILFINAEHDPQGTPILPDHGVDYKSD